LQSSKLGEESQSWLGCKFSFTLNFAFASLIENPKNEKRKIFKTHDVPEFNAHEVMIGMSGFAHDLCRLLIRL
jgi:hypothetical protein